MTSAFTPLGVELMVTGENAGTWGTKTNANLNLIEQISGGYTVQTLNAGSPGGTGASTTTLVKTDGGTGATVATRVIILGAVSAEGITGNKVVTLPVLTENFYLIKNSTSGVFTVQVKAASGSGATVTWATGDKDWKLVYFDGVATNTGAYEVALGEANEVTLTGVETLTNKTLTLPKINEDVTTTSTSTELNKLDALSRGSILYGNASAVTSILTKGAVNQVLTSDGTDISWAAVSGRTGTVNWDTTPKVTGDSPVTTVDGKGYFLNTAGGIIQINLPAGVAGKIVSVADYSASWDTYNVTVAPNGTDKIGGTNANGFLSGSTQSATFVYVDSTQGWVTTMDSTTDIRASNYIVATGGTIATVCTNYKTHTFTGPGTFCVSATGNPSGSNTADYMVVAGGGGSVAISGGGGGAGGFRESPGAASGCYSVSPRGAAPAVAIPISSGTAYPITIGAGGTTGSAGTIVATPGASSIFSTITSAGGGESSETNWGTIPACSSGGSGGGSRHRGSGPGGIGNTPPVSPAQGMDGGGGGPGNINYAGDGGGGGTANGLNGSWSGCGSIGGVGGVGATTSITAAPVAYAGGGGGGGLHISGGGAGGTGGGGNGGGGTGGKGIAGSANTGGGAGGGSYGPLAEGSAGGSGVVVIRYKFQ